MRTNKKQLKHLGLNKIRVKDFENLTDADGQATVNEMGIKDPKPTTDVPAYCKGEPF